jgi:exopolysaccharide biosynthesis polyprenyl glycosylphosphotransferase
MSERSRANYALLRLVSDVILTQLALFLSYLLRPLSPVGQPLTHEHTYLAPIIYVSVGLIWTVAFLLLQVYVPRNLRAIDEAQAIVVAVTLSTLVLAGLLYFSYREVSRLQILMFYAFDLILLIGSRLIVAVIRTSRNLPRYPKRKVLVLGAGETGRDAIQMVESYGWAGLEPVGFLDDDVSSSTEVEGYPVLGSIDKVASYVKAHDIEEVVVALPQRDYDRFFGLLAELQQLAVRVRIVPDYIKTTLLRTVVEEFAGVPMITLQQPSLTPFERMVKRGFDLVVGVATLVLISPLLALIAVAIRLDSPGPVIFRQQRVGENGRLFWMYKFRSMIQGAEEQLAQVARVQDDGQVLYKHRDDPRVTRVGKILRRTSLDELPQIFNTLKGEMSLVGPRPELPWLVDRYEPWQWQRFAVPQGITGWWQVNGRSDKPMHLYTDEDLFYIQNYSLLLDIRILWRTIGAVIKGRGAY